MRDLRKTVEQRQREPAGYRDGAMPTFSLGTDEPDVPESPEALFRDLRPRDTAVRDLYLRQGDVLRAYHEHAQQAPDVALELPTGAGKTLVGLLIAEYRRRAHDERVAFLCPNVQLAQQAATKAAGYGIGAVALVRKQGQWDPAEFQRFQRGRAIAVSTYSAVFNSNPRLDQAQALILDDAHAGEDPVSGLWSIHAERDSALYNALLALVADAIPGATADRLRDADLRGQRRRYVELVPPLALFDRAADLRDTLLAHCPPRTPNRYVLDLWFDQVHRWLLYLGWRELLLRPLVPPTADHAPFAGAKQRVYMSATPGTGGELERAFGVPEIMRPRMPTRDDERGFGRRLFLMPGAAQTPDDADATIRDALALATPQRAVFLAQSAAEIDDLAEATVPEGTKIVPANAIERDANAFVESEPAVLTLANRYDGIDLPDRACRLIVMSGLPDATHLQERFLGGRLGAHRVLDERVRTRLTQGSGRCTRNPQDYAAVILRGSALIDFCSRDEQLSALRPELQAELQLALDSAEMHDADFIGMMRSFFTQDDDWTNADDHLRRRTGELDRTPPPGSSELQESAGREVDAWLARCRGETARAVELAQQAIDRIGGDALRPYRALWLYLAASWARELGEAGDTDAAGLAEQLQADAEAAARSLKWYPRHPRRPVKRLAAEAPDARGDRAAAVLATLGVRGKRFEQRVAAIASAIADDRSGPFEVGLRDLGDLLGFESERPEGDAAPDGVWATDGLWIVWEAKTEKKTDGVLDAGEVRQAETHPRWIERVLGWERPAQVRTVIVMPTPGTHPAVADVGGLQWVVATNEVRAIMASAADAQRAVRARAPGLDDLARGAAFDDEWALRKLDTASLLAQLTSRPVA